MTLALVEIREGGIGTATWQPPSYLVNSDGNSDTGGGCREKRSRGSDSRLEEIALTGLGLHDGGRWSRWAEGCCPYGPEVPDVGNLRDVGTFADTGHLREAVKGCLSLLLLLCKLSE